MKKSARNRSIPKQTKEGRILVILLSGIGGVRQQPSHCSRMHPWRKGWRGAWSQRRSGTASRGHSCGEHNALIAPHTGTLGIHSKRPIDTVSQPSERKHRYATTMFNALAQRSQVIPITYGSLRKRTQVAPFGVGGSSHLCGPLRDHAPTFSTSGTPSRTGTWANSWPLST